MGTLHDWTHPEVMTVMNHAKWLNYDKHELNCGGHAQNLAQTADIQ